MLREGCPRGGRHPLQVPLDAGHPLAQPLAAAVEKRLDGIAILATLRIGARFRIRAGGAVAPGRVFCGGTAHRDAQLPCGGTVPWWITTMPPAVSR